MSIVLNPDKHIVKEANKIIRNEGAGYCPCLLDKYGKAYNCKTNSCEELIDGLISECPYAKYIKTDEGE